MGDNDKLLHYNRGYIGRMENKMETTIRVVYRGYIIRFPKLGISFWGLGFRVYGASLLI